MHQYQVTEIDQSQFPQELKSWRNQAEFKSPPTVPNAALDSAPQIDVLVVYSDDARAAAGSSTAMLNLIDLAVAETNSGYQNSGILQRINLVHSAEVNFNELNNSAANGLDWGKALEQLSETDGVIDEVQSLRNSYAADLVVMLVNDSSFCGIGWLSTSAHINAQNGFSVVSRTCATGYYSFAHEMGHNMGAHHDRATAGSGTAMYEYSYGYQSPSRTFRTIMAYNCPFGSCPRINKWSNPQLSYHGEPTGISAGTPNSADNHLTLNNTAAIVANFRVAATPPPSSPPPPLTAIIAISTLTDVTLSWQDVGTETAYLVEQSLDRGSSWATLATLPQNSISFTINGLHAGVTYYFRISTQNDSGSVPSSPLVITTKSNAVYLPLAIK